jgi:hypothetical protein
MTSALTVTAVRRIPYHSVLWISRLIAEGWSYLKSISANRAAFCKLVNTSSPKSIPIRRLVKFAPAEGELSGTIRWLVLQSVNLHPSFLGPFHSNQTWQVEPRYIFRSDNPPSYSECHAAEDLHVCRAPQHEAGQHFPLSLNLIGCADSK